MLKILEKHIALLFLLCLGFFLLPEQSEACSKTSPKTEQSSCSKKDSEKSAHPHSCQDKSCKKCHHGDQDEDNCQNSCKCAASCGTSLKYLPVGTDLKVKNQFTEEVKKKAFRFRQASYCAGFFSIWLPPKIA